MEHVHTHVTLDTFFALAARAPQRALLLDYDGTLAPFQIVRDEAVPYPGVPKALHTIIAAGRTRVVIISGRAITDLERLLGLDPLPELWGSHGWERRLPDGTYVPPDLGFWALAGLEAARATVVDQGLAHVLEPKRASLAFHWRGQDAATIATLRAAIGDLWSQIARHYGLELQPFDGGLELRVPGRDKGTAVHTLLDELDAGTALAYLGDDLTDEDAFRAIDGRGLRVLVRPDPRPTAADLWLCPPVELLEFLHAWMRMDTSEEAPA